MADKNFTNIYDDGNIPEVDLPQRNSKGSNKFTNSTKTTSTNNSDGIVEPLPESSRPRQDGPGGN